MLKESKKFTIESKSIVGGKEIAGFRAIFETDKPDDISFLPYQIDKDACKMNRKIVREDQAEFEDFAYSIQDGFAAKAESDNK